MILLEELLVEAFTGAGIQLSSTEREDWKAEYVTYYRTGGEGLDSTDREDPAFDFNVYALTRDRALRLAYEAQKVCREDLLGDPGSPVSSTSVGPIVQLPVFNNQYAYTFVMTATVYNPL